MGRLCITALALVTITEVLWMNRFRKFLLLAGVASLAFSVAQTADAGILCNVKCRVQSRRAARANGERPVVRKVVRVVTLPSRAVRARVATIRAGRAVTRGNNAGGSCATSPAPSSASFAAVPAPSVIEAGGCVNGQCTR